MAEGPAVHRRVTALLAAHARSVLEPELCCIMRKSQHMQGPVSRSLTASASRFVSFSFQQSTHDASSPLVVCEAQPCGGDHTRSLLT